MVPWVCVDFPTLHYGGLTVLLPISLMRKSYYNLIVAIGTSPTLSVLRPPSRGKDVFFRCITGDFSLSAHQPRPLLLSDCTNPFLWGN